MQIFEMKHPIKHADASVLKRTMLRQTVDWLHQICGSNSDTLTAIGIMATSKVEIASKKG